MKMDELDEAGKTTRSYRMSARARAAEETGRRIMDAAENLFGERPYSEVTLRDIAEQAGVTPQTVIRRYGSKDGLLRAAAEEKTVEILRSRTPGDPSDTARALRLLLASYEERGDLGWRCLCQEEAHPVLHEMLEQARASHRSWIEECFGHVLPSKSGTEGETGTEQGADAERERRITLLFAATDLYLWKLFRRDLGLDRETTLRRMEELVEAVVRTLDVTATQGERNR